MEISMAANEIHVNDVGTQFRLTIKDDGEIVDISSVTEKIIHFRKPNGTCVEKEASFLTDGTDGILTYLSQDGDLDMAGKWKIQAFVDFGSTEFYSNIDSFKVYRNLC
jgi:hypothetical protein